MKKLWKWISFCLLIAVFFWLGTVFADKNSLKEDLIRLHVVANSDSDEDQALKLQVRDAVMDYLNQSMEKLPDAEQAKQFIQQHLSELEQYVNHVIRQLGSSDSATVSLGKETFGIRQYDTFTLPSGVYESLRITIGDGQGKNWWCVVFPTLCLNAVNRDFEDTAAGAGFSQTLADTLDNNKHYEVRFFFLDILGRIENFFFQR